MKQQFSFREYHLLQILRLHEQNPFPLDLFLKNYFKHHHAIGSKDRKSIADTLYGLMRWQGLVDYFCSSPITWEKRLRTFSHLNPLAHLNDVSIPPHIRVSFPKVFFNLLEAQLGKEKAWQFCLISNETAPTTIRINPLKTTRETLLAKWQGQWAIKPCTYSPLGIEFQKKENFWTFPEFKAGCFEVQDEGSQLIADLVKPRPGAHVLDYCAGAGGKTLAFAHKLEGKGQIYLHDIRPHALQEAKKRLKRAGIQNAQILLPDAPYQSTLHHQMDWILVDAPCSGTGTLRRNPDMKWNFDPQALDRLVNTQREIMEKALRFLKPKGHIIYATCSVLPQENQLQVDTFCHDFNLKRTEPVLSIFPSSGGMDGFFGAVLCRSQAST